jgi:hypothetical protein
MNNSLNDSLNERNISFSHTGHKYTVVAQPQCMEGATIIKITITTNWWMREWLFESALGPTPGRAELRKEIAECVQRVMDTHKSEELRSVLETVRALALKTTSLEEDAAQAGFKSIAEYLLS